MKREQKCESKSSRITPAELPVVRRVALFTQLPTASLTPILHPRLLQDLRFHLLKQRAGVILSGCWVDVQARQLSDLFNPALIQTLVCLSSAISRSCYHYCCTAARVCFSFLLLKEEKLPARAAQPFQPAAHLHIDCQRYPRCFPAHRHNQV